MLHINRVNALVAGLLLLVEIGIAAGVHDTIIRPHIGDLLVVMLIHFILRAFLRITARTAAYASLLFAFAVEASQYAGLIHHLGLSDSTAAKLILGNTFQWWDLAAYTTGALLALAVDRRISATRPGDAPAGSSDRTAP